ncbi:MAG: serine/threonine protein kinase, partial [Myxococcales bacterium]|nr:serine/threonine protein kinase [Myxococcales bacterium]
MGSREVTGGSTGLTGDDRLEATIVADPRPPVPTPLPSRVGRYHVDECIGRGAMGVVLRAHDPSLDRVVAIKLLHAHAPSRDGAKRLLREAQALAQLSHPNVIDVYDVGTVGGRIFIAMEYVAGHTLADWLERRPPPPREAILDAFVQAGRGLAAAHAAGLVHRDFKPANVLRGHDGRVRVVDFGLAAPPREQEVQATLGSQDDDAADVRMTATGFVVGTPAYMSPEAHCGAPADARSDQFSFCVSLFEALWGQRPFLGKTPKEVAAQAANGEIHVPAGADVPAAVRDAVLRGLRAHASERWPSMEALLQALRPPRRRIWPWLLTAGAVGTVTAVALWPRPSPCERAADAVTQIWSDDARSRMQQAFGASGLSYATDTWQRVEGRLQSQAQDLAQARVAA